MNERRTCKLASDGEEAIAQSLAALCSVSQYSTIRALANSINVDFDEICQEMFECQCEELSKSGAEDVIAKLFEMQPEGSQTNILHFPRVK